MTVSKRRKRHLHRSAKPIDLLPSAIHQSIGVVKIAELESFPSFPVTPTAMRGPGGGILLVPGARNAKGRTIRLHEAMHMNLSPRHRRDEIPDMCHQTVEDLRIHVASWPGGDLIDRDMATTAIRDLRHLERVSRMELAYHHAARETFLCVAARSLGMLWAFGERIPRADKYRLQKWNSQMYRRIDETLGFPFVTLAYQVYWCVRNNQFEQAEDLLAKLFTDRPESLTRPMTVPVEPGQASGDLDSMTGQMTVVELDRTMATSTPRSRRTMVLSGSGLRINARRVGPAVVENTTKRLFKRKVRELGGTVVIDASGSMAISNEALSVLCHHAPGASVAYYHADGDNVNSVGKLVVYAKNGRRFHGTLPGRGSGNSVDYWAVKWFLRGAPPRIFVSDGQFCGGPAQQNAAAMKLLLDAVAKGECEWVRTVEDAEQAFREWT